MKRSNILLAVITGAILGGAVALAVKSRVESADETSEIDATGVGPDETENESPAFETIAKQFSDRIAAELHAAERKIKSAVTKGADLIVPDDGFGVFL